ncbi:MULTISPECIES: PhoX family phosphatase [unclassified Dietzia]|uniref:PhoX family protein n=1 Tax=unclassified Dietzia TaxID=2617939 RepID=UPI0015F798E9|nr:MULTISPECIES: PhoX family phosphatase [unclassified Dietzia]MBB1041057.1 PhoX family phosphatase [Dietzia sp. Cai40]MBB1043362.1 PhoX family phosphatase [Dietzia sp. DQ11-44]MBB1058183.1 PhoX family phosphatase [Dietzia sp. B19]
MSVRSLLPIATPGISNRQHLTCVYKCGDQCAAPVPNTSDNPYFGDVATEISRRGALKAAGVVALAVGATQVLPASVAAQGSLGTGSAGAPGSTGGGTLDTGFLPVEPNTADAVTVPVGHSSDVVIRWGDPVVPGAPGFDFENQTAAAQAVQYGFNCDLAVLFPMDDRDDRFLLTVNHEYTTEPMMFRGYDSAAPTREQVEIAWAAHGMTVVELASRPSDGGLDPVMGSYNRRITATTPFELRGPAVGPLTRTTADPTGTRVLGTLNNCAGGHTPWGTVLSGEENFNQYFGTTGSVTDPARVEALRRYGVAVGESGRKWERFDSRFDLAAEPNEVNRFGYIVEVDPWNPDSTPVKHSALGRFKHEGGTVHVTADGTVVIYSGDDERFDYLYKFVSSRKMVPGRTAAARTQNMRILDEGTLYVATFTGNSPESEIDGSGTLPSDGAFDGTGGWIPLMTVDAAGNAVSHVTGMTAEQVAVYTRMAGDAVGATRMDRPEDVEPSPTTGKVYMALTNNTRRTVGQVDEANPRHDNKHGQVVEITDDHAGTTFGWNLLLVCGDPAAADTYFGGFDKSKVSPISCPDNVAFDPSGGLWVSTDGNALGFNDGLYSVATEGPTRGETKLFLTVPIGAETCGPLVFADRAIVNVQHPGEKDGASIENPASHWPDGGTSQPRPSTVVAWRDGFTGGTGSLSAGSLSAGSLPAGSSGS